MTDVLSPHRHLYHSSPPNLSAPLHSLDPFPPQRKTMPSRVLYTEQNGDFKLQAPIETSIPKEPTNVPVYEVQAPAVNGKAETKAEIDDLVTKMNNVRTSPAVLGIDFTRVGRRPRRASTHLVSVKPAKDTEHDILSDSSATNIVTGECCGGGCCQLAVPGFEELKASMPVGSAVPIPLLDNAAFKSLRLKLSPLSSRERLSGITPLPAQERFIRPANTTDSTGHKSTVNIHPPTFVTPHPPHAVYSAKLHGSRELTKDGAEKRTFHFDLDVTDYPEELENVDFRVGGAIGVCAPNHTETVEEIFDRLGIDEKSRDEVITLETTGGRWPTIWGDEQARALTTTRRELLTWTVDIQSYAVTKQQLRVLAEYAENENEKTILLHLCSRQGQVAFCELRTGPYITLIQLLNAFPSSNPPFDVLLGVLPNLMPRFYSLSQDPHTSKCDQRRIIEMAVSVQESDEGWRDAKRTGVGSGFLERQAQKFIADPSLDIRIPMFRGLMSNPLAKEFQADGPMLLIGAGVGIAPFRGFVQRRLKNANCANKVWVLQGVRDSLVDELYSGEWGVHESDIRKVVESRRGTGRYVQEEVRNQADLVWFIINSLDGRVFVCGSSKGMGEGVEEALVDVAMQKGRLRREEAQEFWKKKKAGMQYIAETW